MTGWIALSDRPETARRQIDRRESARPENDCPDTAHRDADRRQTDRPTAVEMMERGTFVLEFTLPLRAGAVLVDFQSDEGWSRTFSIFADPEAGVAILYRQGDSLHRPFLPGPMPRADGTARLSYHFDAPRRRWRMQLDVLGQGTALRSEGTNPLPLRLDDLQQVCAGHSGAERHPSVLWFGAATGADLPDTAPWIGLASLVDTRDGPVAAGALRPGDQVLTVDDGPLPVLRVTRRDLPSCGFFAPVLLRAPFFGRARDLLVSADQLVALAGSLVEYHFGEDEVLIAARSLIDGRSALLDHRRPVTTSVALDLGCPALFSVDGCVLMSDGSNRLLPPPRRVLQPFEVRPLLSQSARSVMRLVA